MTPSRRQVLALFMVVWATQQATASGKKLATLNLDEWTGFEVRYKGQSYVVDADELWNALAEMWQ